jgi:hypothetical protein
MVRECDADGKRLAASRREQVMGGNVVRPLSALRTCFGAIGEPEQRGARQMVSRS